MPINAGHEYFTAEGKYLAAQTLEEKIYWLEDMIKKAPKHKSSENFVSELKTRLRKLQEKKEKIAKKSGGRKGIRKEGFQFVLIGKTNSGKSLLLNKLTNANSSVGEYWFTTKKPVIGTFEFEGTSAQVIDLPSVGSENFDVGLVNNADCLIFVVEDLNDLKELGEVTWRNKSGKRLVVVSKADNYDETELRKIEAKIKSKKINGLIVSALSGFGIGELRRRMFFLTGMIRIYLKEPGKVKQERPMVLKEGSSIKDVAEGILKGFSKTVKETRISGPSSKFPNQRVGLNHKVKDLDIIEFHTR